MKTPHFIRVVSDLHLDFDIPQNPRNFLPQMLWHPEKMENDSQTVLIIAGDIWHAKKPFSFMGYSWVKEIAKQFQYVIIVLGNHDFWGGNLPKEYDNYTKKIKEQELNNVFLLQNNSVVLGEVKFVGGTLWTDYNRGDPACMQLAESGLMQDYKYIRNGVGFFKLRANKILAEHLKTRLAIEELAVKDYPEQKLWVVTHHLPTICSIPIENNEDGRENENSLYYSDMDNFIEQKDIDVWVHGHSHRYQEYDLGKTKIIANPRGYTSEDTGFNPWAVFDLKGNAV